MNTLEIKLTGGLPDGTVVTVDGERVKFKKNEFGSLVYKHATDKDRAKIEVFRLLDVGGVWWFIVQLLFFIISIFGLFDIHRKNDAFTVDFETDVVLNGDGKINLCFNPPKDEGPAITVETDLQTEITSNSFGADAGAKRIYKLLKFAKIALAVVIVAIVIAVLISKLLGG